MSTHPAAAFRARLSSQQDGYVVAVRGAIVDVRFSGDALPAVGDALLVMPGDLAQVLAEVQAHLSETTVRALALQTTAGLRRGTLVGSVKPWSLVCRSDPVSVDRGHLQWQSATTRA